MTEPNPDIPESEHGRKIFVRVLVTPQPKLLTMRSHRCIRKILVTIPIDVGPVKHLRARGISALRNSREKKKGRCRECKNNGN
jgi:hypothetical protein